MKRPKMIRKKGMFIVEYDGRERLFRNLHDAWQYIFYLRIIARNNGEKMLYQRNTLYPVYSLLPPVVERTAYFYDLGEETI